MAAPAQHGEDGIAAQPLEGASCQAAVALHVSDLGLYATAPSEQLFELGCQYASGARDQNLGLFHAMATIAGKRFLPPTPPVSGKLSAALFFSNFQVGGIGR